MVGIRGVVWYAGLGYVCRGCSCLCAPSRTSKSWGFGIGSLGLPAERGAKIIAPSAVGQPDKGAPGSPARRPGSACSRKAAVTRSFLTLIFGGASCCSCCLHLSNACDC